MDRAMKTITFRPLRLIKKNGKITVASYLQWRAFHNALLWNRDLVINSDYKNFNPAERVHNHKGELLFWYNHQDPQALPKPCLSDEMKEFLAEEFEGEEWKMNLTENKQTGFHYTVKGFDCDGVPAFSHYTQDYISKFYDDVREFEILTVGTVVKWFGYMLYQIKQ